MSNAKAQFEIEKKLIKQSAIYALLIVVVLWLIKITEVLFDISLIQWGIHPRHLDGLAGILFSPLIHADKMHLYSNSIPLFFLGTGLFYYYRKSARWIFILLYLPAGLAIWLFARDSWHIGASGIVYGLVTFIFFSGIFRKEAPGIALALIVTFLYGGMIWGVLPIESGVSWEAHLFGAIGGLLTSIIHYYKEPPVSKKQFDDWEEKYAAGYNEDGDFDYLIDEDY